MTSGKASSTNQVVAVRIRLRGQVQGFGVRPAIARLADKLDLVGSVANDGEGVVIHAEGFSEAVAQFSERLLDSTPPAATVQDRICEPAIAKHSPRFQISVGSAGQQMSTLVPPDIAVCAACLKDVANADGRRFAYAFTSCTNCGPRYSIIRSMPYERGETSMASFDFCQRCASEYEAAPDRRFHAQTNACAKCGPSLWITDQFGKPTDGEQQAIELAAAALLSGKIVAIKVPSGTIAMRFHRSIANALAAIASAYDLKIVISGGCFQNRILTELLVDSLQRHPCPVGLPGKIPPNDGGLAAGQLAIAHASL